MHKSKTGNICIEISICYKVRDNIRIVQSSFTVNIHSKCMNMLLCIFYHEFANMCIFLINSGAGDKILKRWPLPIGTVGLTKLVVSHNVRGHDKDINTLAVSPNDSMAASGSQDKTIRLWRTSDLGPIATLSGHKRGVWKVAFSPVDRCLVSCSGDRTLRLWSVVDYSCLRVFEGIDNVMIYLYIDIYAY